MYLLFCLLITCSFSMFNPFKDTSPKHQYLSNELKIRYFDDINTCSMSVPEVVDIVNYNICNNGIIYTNAGKNVNITFYNDNKCKRYMTQITVPKDECYPSGKNSFVYADVQMMRTVNSSSYHYNKLVLLILFFMIFIF